MDDVNAPPDEGWKWIPAICGLPVEMDAEPLETHPILTWSLSAVIAAVSILAFFDLERVVDSFGLVPAEFWRYGGLTLLTSFLLHGGVWHLVSNLYFFLLLGDNVEDCIGRKKMALLLVAATVLGDVLHAVAEPRSTEPCVGASGGISGVLAFYALQFPRARIGFMWRFFWMRIPAWGAFTLWMLLQGFGLIMQLSGFSNVSALAHLGGVAAGVGLWFCWRGKLGAP
jgi:membrane associated rhomboid family serine protease